MSSENEFEFEGKTYVAVEHENDGANCVKCAFWRIDCFDDDELVIPQCCSVTREDGKSVYFEEKQ